MFSWEKKKTTQINKIISLTLLNIQLQLTVLIQENFHHFNKWFFVLLCCSPFLYDYIQCIERDVLKVFDNIITIIIFHLIRMYVFKCKLNLNRQHDNDNVLMNIYFCCNFHIKHISLLWLSLKRNFDQFNSVPWSWW